MTETTKETLMEFWRILLYCIGTLINGVAIAVLVVNLLVYLVIVILTYAMLFVTTQTKKYCQLAYLEKFQEQLDKVKHLIIGDRL